MSIYFFLIPVFHGLQCYSCYHFDFLLHIFIYFSSKFQSGRAFGWIYRHQLSPVAYEYVMHYCDVSVVLNLSPLHMFDLENLKLFRKMINFVLWRCDKCTVYAAK